MVSLLCILDLSPTGRSSLEVAAAPIRSVFLRASPHHAQFSVCLLLQFAPLMSWTRHP